MELAFIKFIPVLWRKPAMRNIGKIGIMAVLFALSVAINAPVASAVSWTDWNANSIVSGANGSGSGVITVGSDTIGVALSGLVYNFENGDYYFNNGSTGYLSPAGTYGGLAPSDMIREVYSGTVTISFSQAVVDPYIALVSVGQGGLPVNYAFQNLQNPIQVISSGSNYWGYTGYTLTGNTFTGREYNGILKLAGEYSSITFSISPNENWHGFNIGVDSAADAVPEPSTMLLLGAGLIGLVGINIRKKFGK